MPFGMDPQCATCKSTTASMWSRGEGNEIYCYSCYLDATSNKNKSNSNGCHFTLRKSTRAKSSKAKQQTTKLTTAKGKSRRVAFKKSCTKAPLPVAEPIDTLTVFHDKSYLHVGDIVSLKDENEDTYYAQVRGLLEDQYCDKCAVITWLIPTSKSPEGRFDPDTYLVGPEEELPRKLDCMQFVCAAPNGCYKPDDDMDDVLVDKPDFGFLMSKTGPQITQLPKKLRRKCSVPARFVNCPE